MQNRHAFEAIDRTLKDLHSDPRSFGGAYSVSVEIFIKYLLLFLDEPMRKLYQYLSNALLSEADIMSNVYPSPSICDSFAYKGLPMNDYVKRNLQIIFLL